jgi:hypothetical protein
VRELLVELADAEESHRDILVEQVKEKKKNRTAEAPRDA